MLKKTVLLVLVVVATTFMGSCDKQTRVIGTLVLAPGQSGDVQNSRVELWTQALVQVAYVSSGDKSPSVSPFEFTDVQPGYYFVVAYKDLDNSGGITNGDIVGVIGGKYQPGQGGTAVNVKEGQTYDCDTLEMWIYTGGGGGDKGWIYINSAPQGAAIWVNGSNTGGVTPATMEGTPGNYQIKLTLTGYQDWQQSVACTAGETTAINATLQQGGGGGGDCQVTGTVSFPGHTLSNNANAYIDTVGTGGQPSPILATQVNPGNGGFTFQFTINGDMQVVAEAWDDANGNQQYDAGDGWGFYDKDGDTQWTQNDMLTIGPGKTVPNVNIVLSPVTDGAKRPTIPWRKPVTDTE